MKEARQFQLLLQDRWLDNNGGMFSQRKNILCLLMIEALEIVTHGMGTLLWCTAATAALSPSL